MQLCSHITIMSGEVVVFAPDFIEDKQAVFGGYDPIGCYEISSSEAAVLVHKCIINDAAELEEFIAAMRAAFDAHSKLRGRKAGSMIYPRTPTNIPKE